MIKLKALRDISDKITQQMEYTGTIQIVMEDRGSNTSPRFSEKLVAIVFNDNGKWSTHSASYFVPADE